MGFYRVLSMILKENPDVITMQELDHHFDFMLPKLRSFGYDGIFQPKHKSKGAEFNGGLPDGVGIFWNTQRIRKVGEVPVGWPPKNGTPTGSLTDASVDGKKNGKRAKQVVMAVKLQVQETEKEKAKDFLMMTAHVKSGNKPTDLPAKIAQGQEVAGIIIKQIAANANIPVIFACDFNNAPGADAHSAFFKALSARGTDVIMSAYSNVIGGFKGKATPTYEQMVNAEPEYTTDKWRKGGTQVDKRGKTAQTIDYIFYTPKDFEISRVLGMPPKKDLEEFRMPGWRYPSDHFYVSADLVFRSRRRMAQRERSNRRDSPVMRRLLQEIIDAQDK